MLYNMFCIFIGVTFANLGREGGNRARCETRFAAAQKRTTIKTKNAPTHHEPVHKDKLKMIMK